MDKVNNNNSENPAIIINNTVPPAEENDDEVCPSPYDLTYTPPSLPTFPFNKVKCHAKGCLNLPKSVHTPLITSAAQMIAPSKFIEFATRNGKEIYEAKNRTPTVEFCTCV
jgi:hypothetical protein